MPPNIYEVFHPIHGLIVDTPGPVVIGDFTFYQFPRDRQYALNQYFPNDGGEAASLFFIDFPDDVTVVSVKVTAPDTETAEITAEKLFIQLTHIFSIQTFGVHEFYDVTVFDEKAVTQDINTILSSSGGSQSFSIKGVRRKIEISKFLALRDSRCFEGLIKKLTSKSLTEFEKRVLLSVDFCGMAIQGIGQPSGFIQAVTSIECLFSMDKTSLAKSISENYAFIMASGLLPRKKLRDKIRSIYRMRSKLAHGEDSTIGKEECIMAIGYAHEAIVAFVTDDKLLKIATKQDFINYIDILKFGTSEDK